MSVGSGFSLTLMVNHACNLRCTYCYTGTKFHSPMPAEVGNAAIDRALNSMPSGGWLDLGFFGGEPLLEAPRILDWMKYARDAAAASRHRLGFSLTTNGTLARDEAWRVMLDPALELTVSFDGAPQTHDRHRRDATGEPTSAKVSHTLQRLIAVNREFTVNVVIRPDTVGQLPDSLEFLHELGVDRVNLSLDLWTSWTADDGRKLESAIHRAAQLWSKWLPNFSVNWFDTKVGSLARLPVADGPTKCGFGKGEIAVAPSGNLYPCERLIGEDAPNQPLRLPSHVLDGATDFTGTVPPFARCADCSGCELTAVCETYCRCSNYIRTGDVNRPDGLLCLLNRATTRAVVDVLAPQQLIATPKTTKDERPCYA